MVEFGTRHHFLSSLESGCSTQSIFAAGPALTGRYRFWCTSIDKLAFALWWRISLTISYQQLWKVSFFLPWLLRKLFIHSSTRGRGKEWYSFCVLWWLSSSMAGCKFWFWIRCRRRSVIRVSLESRNWQPGWHGTPKLWSLSVKILWRSMVQFRTRRHFLSSFECGCSTQSIFAEGPPLARRYRF